jgi:hypothetical protein
MRSRQQRHFAQFSERETPFFAARLHGSRNRAPVSRPEFNLTGSFQSEVLGTFAALEVQFQRALQYARCCSADGTSERRTADVPVHRAWSIKLGVVEDVEAFYAEQQRL